MPSHHWIFKSLVTSEEQLQEPHTSDMSLPTVCLGSASEWLKEVFLTQPPQNHYHIISMEFLQSFLRWHFARWAKCLVLSWARHLAAVIHNWFSHLRHKAWSEVDQTFLQFYFPLLPPQSFVVFCLQAKAKPKFCLQGPTNEKSYRQNFLCWFSVKRKFPIVFNINFLSQINHYFYSMIKIAQGCALAVPGGPLVPNFCSQKIEDPRFLLEIICRAPWISQVQSTGLPSIFLRAQCFMLMVILGKLIDCWIDA